METTSQTLLAADADETTALDLLEAKVIAIVEQLQESRILRERAEARAAELEETVDQLRSRNAAAIAPGACNPMRTPGSRIRSSTRGAGGPIGSDGSSDTRESACRRRLA